MIKLLPEPLDGESVQTGLPLVILALAMDSDGDLCAVAVGDAGEAMMIPWDKESLKIPWRFNFEKNEWVDEGPLTAMGLKKLPADGGPEDDEP